MERSVTACSVFCNRRYSNDGFKTNGAPNPIQSQERVSAGIANEKSAVFENFLENG